MRLRLSRLLLPITLAFGAVGPALPAQVNRLPTRVEPRLEAAAAVPFGPGELLRYDVRLGALGRRGEGYMQVVGLDTVRGHTTYHVSMAIEGGLLFAKVKDHYDSWFDVTDLITLRFIQDVDEINYERYRHWELFGVGSVRTTGTRETCQPTFPWTISLSSISCGPCPWRWGTNTPSIDTSGRTEIR